MAALPLIALNAGMISVGTAVTASSVIGTLGAIGTGLSLASTVGSLFSNQSKTGSEIDAANANATIARQNAATTVSQTEASVQQQQRDAVIRRGQSIAAASGSGLGIGSKADILSDNAAQEELDILTLKHTGQLKQNSYLQDAALSDASAAAKKRAYPLGQAAIALTGAAKSFGVSQVV